MAFGLTFVHTLILSLIVVLALMGNSLVIYILFSRRKTFLNKPYCIFILNLAIVDFLTAIFLIFSRFLYLPPAPDYGGIAAEFYCLTIWSGQFAFNMGYISIFTCVSLTVERWIAVVKPNTYRTVKAKHAVITVFVVWFLGITVNFTTYFRIHYDSDENICKWGPYPFAAKAFPWIDLTVQSIVPYPLMVALYTHIYFRLKSLPRLSATRDSQLRKVTVVAWMACSALIIGWLPARITFMLSKFGYLSPNSVLHNSLLLITFANSCVNPWLYGIYSPKFRAEYKTVLTKVFSLCRRTSTKVPTSSRQVSAATVGSANKHAVQRPPSLRPTSNNAVPQAIVDQTVF